MFSQRGGITLDDLDLFIIAVSGWIAEEWSPAFCRQYGPPRRAGFAPALRDPECLTLDVVGHYLGYSQQEDLDDQMRRQSGAGCPAVPDRVACGRPSAKLWQGNAWLHRRLVTVLGGDHAPGQSIETGPVPICTLARRWRRTSFRTAPRFECPDPTNGSCAANDEEAFGFTGGLRMTTDGLSVHAAFLHADGHERQCRAAFLTGGRPGTTVIGEKAFLDRAEPQRLQTQAPGVLLTPVQRNLHVEAARPPFGLPRPGDARRRVSETVTAPLVDRVHLTTMKGRDVWHLLNLWITKSFAQTLCVFLTRQLHRDP